MDLKDNERIEDLGIENLKVIQDPNGYCFGTDSVLLSNFVKANHSDKCLELCAGGGAVSFLVWGKKKPKSIVGVELQPRLCDMANRSSKLNGLENEIRFENISLQEAHKVLGNRSFDVIFCNPPYNLVGTINCDDEERLIARQEVKMNLEELGESVNRLLKFGGKFFLIYRADRLAEVCSVLNKNCITPKVMQLVYSNPTKNAELVLLECISGAKNGIQILPPKELYK